MPSDAEAMVRAVARVAKESGVQALSEFEKDILLPWWARGVVDNGGFEYLCECERDVDGIAQRFRTIGLPELASAIETVVEGVYGGVGPPADERQRDALLAKVDWRRFDSQWEVVLGVTFELMLAAIERYVRLHPRECGRVRAWVAAHEGPE